MRLEAIHVCPIKHRYVVDEDGAVPNDYIGQDEGERYRSKRPLLRAVTSARTTVCTSGSGSTWQNQASIMWLRMA